MPSPPQSHALPRSRPEAQGVPSAAILSFVAAAERETPEPHSLMLLRHGHVIAEGWWAPYGPQHPHMLFSLSKSFASTAAGLAVAEGLLSLDDPVLQFFPDEAPPDVSPHLAAMRVRHLLSMSTGHDRDTTGRLAEGEGGDWVRGFLAQPVAHEPGTHFVYNSGATYMAASSVPPELFLMPDKVFRMGNPPLRIEILTRVSGVEFAACWEAREVAILDETTVNVINLDDLKRNKLASGRLKGKNDVEHLP